MSVGRLGVGASHQARIMAAVLRDAYVRPLPRATDGPLVTVVIAAYNRAEVLRYSLASALRQSYRRIEVLVVGDACTDDSEQVVRDADDARVRWMNLPENTGSQAGPNRAGVEAARGELIAYLGQDDVWRRDHLALLVADLEGTGVDVSSTVTALTWPRPVPSRRFLSPRPGSFVPPSSVMHHAGAAAAAGGWRDYRETAMAPDADMICRMAESGARYSRVRALTVVKFASAHRPGAYDDPSTSEQAAATRRVDTRSFVAREVLTALALAPFKPWYQRDLSFDEATMRTPGAVVTELRRIRGLEP